MCYAPLRPIIRRGHDGRSFKTARGNFVELPTSWFEAQRRKIRRRDQFMPAVRTRRVLSQRKTLGVMPTSSWNARVKWL